MWKADIAKTIFAKYSMADVWQSFEYVSVSEYALVLNNQSYEDASVTEGYENTRSVPENEYLRLNMPECVLIRLKPSNVWRLLPIHWTLNQPWKVNMSI